MKHKIFIFSLFAIFFSIRSFGQSPEIDSLQNLLKNAKEDTNKVILLSEISYALAPYDSDIALQYAKLGIFLGEKLEFKRGLANCYKSIGVIYFYEQDFQQALENYFKCANISRKIDDKDILASALKNIGSIYYYQGNYDLALEKLEKSLAIQEELGDDLKIASVLNTLSILYQEQGNYPLALQNYLRCLKIYQQHNDKKMISSIYNNIGSTYYYQGFYDQALDNFFKSLTIAEELSDSFKIAQTYLNIGGIYDNREEYDKALDYFNKSVLILEDQDEKYDLAIAYDNIGKIYKKLEDNTKSLEFYSKSLEISEEIGDQSGIGLSLMNISELYIITGDYKKALDYSNRSLIINEEIGDVINIGLTYKNIGEIYFKLGYYDKALKYYSKAKKIGEKIGALENEKDASEALSRVFAKQNNYKLAYENHVLYKEISDKLKNDANVKSIAQREIQYEFDKKQKIQELEKAQKEAERKAERKREKLIRFIFIFIIIFGLVFALFILRSYRIIKKSNILLAEQRDQITQQKEAITDSIIYAKRIQTAVLPSPDYASEILSEHFILFKPRDIVSGDFFWMTQRENKSIIVAADCTGHGVPGAFMSMLGVSFLNEIVNKNETTQANLILNQLRAAVKKTLDQTGKKDEAKDGMDLALCIFDYENNKMQYAGAYNPLYLYRNNELIETKADKMPIGIYVKERESFINHEIELQKGDTFYIFSDGFVDQFGGERGQKFMSRKFKALLLEIQDKSMSEQKEILDTTIEEWRGKHDQLDDICVIGIRI